MNEEYFQKLTKTEELRKKELEYWKTFVPSGGMGHYAKNIKIEALTEKLDKIENKFGTKYVIDFNELIKLFNNVQNG